MTAASVIAGALLATGAVFFLAGTLGLLRFPDVYARLHALTKADNVGLGCVAAGIAIDAGQLSVALELAVVWVLVLISSSISSQLIARSTWHRGIRPWRRP